MLLHVENLTKHIAERVLFRDMSLGIDEGEVLALCGPSGSGKTTLTRILSGLTSFDDGQITIGAQTFVASGEYPRELHGKIGVVFQRHNLFPHLTVIANVTLALRKVRGMGKIEARERGMAELKRMGLAAQAGQFPMSLSGGERQRTAIARSLAMDPLLMLLDEPTSGLDPLLIGEVLRAIHELADGGVTMLLITHNLTFARKTAKHFAVLQNGTLVQSPDSAILDPLEARWSRGF